MYSTSLLLRRSTCVVAIAAAFACSAGDEPSVPRYATSATGVVRDIRAGREWTARDSGREMSWPEADRHCRALDHEAAGQAWRLPSIEELAGLYVTSADQPCGKEASCRVDPAIDLSSPYQWSATAPKPDRRFYFDFALGSRLAPLIRPSLTRRALCTRAYDDEGR